MATVNYCLVCSPVLWWAGETGVSDHSIKHQHTSTRRWIINIWSKAPRDDTHAVSGLITSQTWFTTAISDAHRCLGSVKDQNRQYGDTRLFKDRGIYLLCCSDLKTFTKGLQKSSLRCRWSVRSQHRFTLEILICPQAFRVIHPCDVREWGTYRKILFITNVIMYGCPTAFVFDRSVLVRMRSDRSEVAVCPCVRSVASFYWPLHEETRGATDKMLTADLQGGNKGVFVSFYT